MPHGELRKVWKRTERAFPRYVVGWSSGTSWIDGHASGLVKVRLREFAMAACEMSGELVISGIQSRYPRPSCTG
jgi:hypothetical protein